MKKGVAKLMTGAMAALLLFNSSAASVCSASAANVPTAVVAVSETAADSSYTLTASAGTAYAVKAAAKKKKPVSKVEFKLLPPKLIRYAKPSELNSLRQSFNKLAWAYSGFNVGSWVLGILPKGVKKIPGVKAIVSLFNIGVKTRSKAQQMAADIRYYQKKYPDDGLILTLSFGKWTVTRQ